MARYKITRHVPELNMFISSEHSEDMSTDEMARTVNLPPTGMRKVLSRAVRIENLDTREVVAL